MNGGGHQSTSGSRFRLDGGIPSAGMRGNGCWTPPPFFGGGMGPTTTTVTEGQAFVSRGTRGPKSCFVHSTTKQIYNNANGMLNERIRK